MLTTLLSLLGGSLGGLLRFVPEILKIFRDGKERSHELDMAKLQLQIDQARASQQLDLVHAQADASSAVEEMKAYVEAIRGQGKMTGVPWIDGLNQSVRPVVTYWWMLLFTVYKICTIVASILHWVDIDTFLAELWTPQDAGILAMILGFWFVDRAIRHTR